MRRTTRIRTGSIIAALGLIGTVGWLSDGPAGASPHTAAGVNWLSFSGGHLVYGHDANGNRIPDFSSVGYADGNAPVPAVPTAVTVTPSPSGDDTTRIQMAIDKVSAMTPGSRGIRGAVVLAAGTYRIGGALDINAGGVVLRGGGASPADTKLVATGSTDRDLITATGTGSITQTGPTYQATNTYAPVGSYTLRLNTTSGLAVGDQVIVQRPQTQAWIDAIGMNDIPPRPGTHTPESWSPNPGPQYERQITAIKGDTIRLNIPLVDAIQSRYGGATVYRYTFPGRISQVGIENLTANGSAMSQTNYDASNCVVMDRIIDSWVRDIDCTEFGGGFGFLGGNATRVSVLGVHVNGINVNPSEEAQPSAYGIDGQQLLLANCSVSGTDYHAWVTQAETAGPDVITNCTATNTGQSTLDAGPHQRWATGILFDDDHIQGMQEVMDRSWFGSGQGWAGAWSAVYNGVTSDYLVEDPPLADNWAIGVTGTMLNPSQGVCPCNGIQQGEMVSPGKPVRPASLYRAQLAARHGHRG